MDRYISVGSGSFDLLKLSELDLLFTRSGHKVKILDESIYQCNKSYIAKVIFSEECTDIPVIYNHNGFPVNMDHLGFIKSDLNLFIDTWKTEWVNISYDSSLNPIFSRTYKDLSDALNHRLGSELNTIQVSYPKFDSKFK